MNKPTFDAMVAQYKKPTIEGEGAASWDKGVRCVIPEVQIGGKAVQDGTPSPDAPVMPEFSVGTTVVSRGKNLVNLDYDEYNAAEFWVGKKNVLIAAQETVRYKENTQYTITFDAVIPNDSDAIMYMRFRYTDGTLSGFPNTEIINGQRTMTSGANKTVRQVECTSATSGKFTLVSLQIEEGTTVTPYTPYFDGGTAVAPELLAIPGTDIRDEWNPQTGMGVRRVGVQSFDGTENWNFSAGYGTEHYNAFYAISHPAFVNNQNNLPTFCTHLPRKPGNWYAETAGVVGGVANKMIYFYVSKTAFPDLETFKAWVTTQHAAGTPVTCWYALEEPIPFQTDPAPLIQPPGTGHIMQTGGTLKGVPITVTPVTHS